MRRFAIGIMAAAGFGGVAAAQSDRPAARLGGAQAVIPAGGIGPGDVTVRAQQPSPNQPPVFGSPMPIPQTTPAAPSGPVIGTVPDPSWPTTLPGGVYAGPYVGDHPLPGLVPGFVLRLAGVVLRLAGQFLGVVGFLAGPFGGLLRPSGPLNRPVEPVLRLLGRGPGARGQLVRSRLLLGVGPAPGQVGGLGGHVGGVARHRGGFLGSFGPLLRLIGPLLCLIGPTTRPIGEFLRLLGVRPALAGVLLDPDAGGALRGRLVLDRVPGHAVRFAGLGHPLASGGLPRLVLRHDYFFPAGRPASARHG